MNEVRLVNRHLAIDAATAETLFPGATHLNVVYYRPGGHS